MMSPNEQDDAGDSEIVESQPADPFRAAFAAAIAAVLEALPPSWMRDVAVKEVMIAYERTKVALVRRYVN